MKLKLLSLFTAVFLCSSAHAQVFIEQGKVSHLVAPGDHLSDSVTVHNTTDKNVRVRMYWEDFAYVPPYDGAKKFSPAATLKSSLASWVQFSPQYMDLGPFAKTQVKYTIKVPSNARGGYYGVLFIEPQNKGVSDNDKGVRIITRVGSLFFVETGDRNKKASLKDASISNGIFKARLSNEGDVILLPQSSYYIMDREGLLSDRGELKKYYLPPDKSVDIELPLSKGLSKGEYTLVLTFDLQDGDVLVKEVDISKNSDFDHKLHTIRD